MDYFIEGLRLINAQGLRRYVVIPLIINILSLAAVIAYGISKYDDWTFRLTESLPDWLSFLSGVFAVLAATLVLVVLLYLFTIFANIIASPFNAILSVKVEERLKGQTPGGNTGLALVLVRSVLREFEKLLYYLPRLIGLVIVTLIPAINAAAPFLWILFGAWMMSIQYVDYAADNNEVTFKEMRELLGRERFPALSFGLITYIALAIPVLNLVLIPAAVAGGTAFWVDRVAAR